MFRLVSVLTFTLLLFFLPELILANQCHDLLNSSAVERSDHDEHEHHEPHGHAHHQHKNETLVKITQVLERLNKHGLIKDDKLFKRIKHDLGHLNHEIEEKQEFEVFQKLFDKWTPFIKQTLQQFDRYEKLGYSEKEQWKDKLELVGRFAISQFVVFLEVEGRIKAEPVYKKQNQILSYMNSLPEDLSFKLFSFELEKQIKRFFSVSEIKKCKFFGEEDHN